MYLITQRTHGPCVPTKLHKFTFWHTFRCANRKLCHFMTPFSISMERIERRKYIDELVSLQRNGMIKVITGMRRCGRSELRCWRLMIRSRNSSSLARSVRSWEMTQELPLWAYMTSFWRTIRWNCRRALGIAKLISVSEQVSCVIFDIMLFEDVF